MNRMSGVEAARRILGLNGLYAVRVEPAHDNLSDHYDQRRKTFRLRETVFSVPSIASVVVAAHEAGHAI